MLAKVMKVLLERGASVRMMEAEELIWRNYFM